MEAIRNHVPGWRAAVIALCLFQSPTGGGASPSLPVDVRPCAPCHHRGGSDPVAEWLASPYSEIEGGRGCTDCHGASCPANGLRARADTRRAASRSDAVGLSVTAVCSGKEVTAEVAVSNVGVGHGFPTGSDERTLVLEVAAFDRDGARLPTRPASRDASTGSSVARPPLAPFATDVNRFRFVAPAFGPASISARLLLVSSGAASDVIADAHTTCRTTERVR